MIEETTTKYKSLKHHRAPGLEYITRLSVLHTYITLVNTMTTEIRIRPLNVFICASVTVMHLKSERSSLSSNNMRVKLRAGRLCRH